MSTGVALRPSYWASVSGGKDSLYMLKLILEHPELYPLDGVVHFELEIDYPFIKNVIDYMESECKRYGIRFVRIKPRKTWEEMYNELEQTQGGKFHKRGFPTRKARWCNSRYKLDSAAQLKKFLESTGAYLVNYIGYCADEVKRYEKRKDNGREIYPLVEFGINEGTILQWAKTQPIFNHFYETQRRCGCMYCPMMSMIGFAYLYKYYPENFRYMMDKAKETEIMREGDLGRPFSCFSKDPYYNADYIEMIVKKKYVHILNDMEQNKQIDMFEMIKEEENGLQ